MRAVDDTGMMTREICNIRFLIEQQIRLIDDLDGRGLDGRAAHDLLRKLMRRDQELQPVIPPMARNAPRECASR